MPESGVYRMRLDEGLRKKAEKQAKAEQRSLASLIRFLLDRYLKDKQ